MPHPQQNDAFVVLEGNRRVVALMILESPQRAAPVLSAAERRTLDGLHRAFVKAPIEEVFCVVLKDPEDFNHWITLRHTGKNDGKGLSSWKPGGQDRYLARHGNQVPAPRTQVEQFVLSSGGLSAGGPAIRRHGVLTTIERVINNPNARKRFGIEIREGHVYSVFPADEIVKPLTHLVGESKAWRPVELAFSQQSYGD